MTWTRARALAAPGALAVALFSLGSSAQPGRAPAKAPAKDAVPNANADAGVSAPTHASALVRVAEAIARGIGAVDSGALVVASPLASDVPAPKGGELAVRLATQIAGRLGSGRVHPEPASLASAHAAAGRAASLVHVQVEIAKGELRATADVYGAVANGWERLKQTSSAPRAHAYAAAPIDAEVRSFLSPILLEQARVHKARHDEADVLAVGCGDVDGDGGNELVIASRARVAVGKVRGGKVVLTRATPWARLAARAPVPMREPIATVVVPDGRGEVLVGTTDRGGVALDVALSPRRALYGLPLPGAGGDACATALPELGALDGSGVACDATPGAAPRVVLAMPAPRFDVGSALRLVGQDGTPSEILAARDATGAVRLRRTDATGTSADAPPLEGAGAQLVLADLDLDGVPEIVASGDARPPDAEGDTLTIWSWRPSGIAERLRLSTKDEVRAIGVCPPEDRGVPALVAVVGSEVWLLR